jgi:hypothetical protein
MPLNVDKISTGSLSVNGIDINKNGVLQETPIEIRVYN